MHCHHCGKKVVLHKKCPKCGIGEIKPFGIGSQFVEELVKKMFTKSRVQRLDTDIDHVNKNEEKQNDIIDDFNAGEINILVGTKMLFRSIDFQKVGLIGIVFAENLLNIPDYRASETSFQFIYSLIMNMKSQSTGKKVVIQTYQPDHPSIKALENNNFSDLYHREILDRKELDYPPFANVIKIGFLSRKREKTLKQAWHFIDYAQKKELIKKYKLSYQLNKSNVIVVQENNRYVVNFILKLSFRNRIICDFKKELKKYISNYRSNEVKLFIDVDPVKMY